MARPTRDTVQSGVNGWDATLNDNLIKVFDRPFAIHEHTGDESDIEATFPAASFDNCLVWVNHSVDGWQPYHSNGTSWANFTVRFAGTFTALTDTPASYSGHTLKTLRVNAGETGIEFAAPATGDFLGLTDTPGSYSGETLKLVRVNAGETALEFTVAAAGDYVGLTDTPSSFSGEALKIPRVNSGETALEFVTPANVAANTPVIIAASDETTALGVATSVVTVRMPGEFSLAAVRASLTTASSTGTVTIDINVAGSTILSTKITIDATELTSETAATPPVLTASTIADDAEITIDIDDAGSSADAAGLKIYLEGTQTASFLDYSASEVDTGSKWTGGETIYRKTVAFGGLPNATTKSVAHSITGLLTVIKFEAMSDDGTDQIPLPWSEATGPGHIQILINNTNIVIDTSDDRTGFTVTPITIYYTRS